MWLLKTILFVALLGILVVVALANDSPVDVRLFGWHVQQAPLFLVMFGAALVGLLAGLLLTAIREFQFRMLLSKQLRERNMLEREVRDLRAAPVDGLDEDGAGTLRGPERPGSGPTELRP
jgi:uncharacterized integral membrane protein